MAANTGGSMGKGTVWLTNVLCRTHIGGSHETCHVWFTFGFLPPLFLFYSCSVGVVFFWPPSCVVRRQYCAIFLSLSISLSCMNCCPARLSGWLLARRRSSSRIWCRHFAHWAVWHAAGGEHARSLSLRGFDGGAA